MKFTKKGYSQGGEDLILAKLFNYKKKGFFIDVGANDPVKLNNTYLFYKLGWSGLNFEPIPELAEKFKEKRKRDIVITKAMSNFVGEADFTAGISEYHVNSSLLDINLPKKNTIKVPVDKLENILSELNITDIDFISIDTEGTEVDVLEGLNLDKYKPKLILAEYNTASRANDRLSPFLVNKGYQPIFINTWNIIYSQNFTEDAIKCHKSTHFTLKNTLRYLLNYARRK
ncbi:MAG: FkbM family methyltransferase [Bacteroidota bacterium]|nr:FkbM family methyltransferase [Bacteroidota bacterium]